MKISFSPLLMERVVRNCEGQLNSRRDAVSTNVRVHGPARVLESSCPPSFAILNQVMSANTPFSRPSGRDRREYYRITVTLPIRLQVETDQTEGECAKKPVNISGGGIGVTVTVRYQSREVLSLTLLLPDQLLFKSFVEVLRNDPVPKSADAYRLHARFVNMTAQNRELLIRHIVRFQRDHLQEHYSV